MTGNGRREARRGRTARITRIGQPIEIDLPGMGACQGRVRSIEYSAVYGHIWTTRVEIVNEPQPAPAAVDNQRRWRLRPWIGRAWLFNTACFSFDAVFIPRARWLCAVVAVLGALVAAACLLGREP